MHYINEPLAEAAAMGDERALEQLSFIGESNSRFDCLTFGYWNLAYWMRQ
jgi:hypothetical protein